MSISNSRVNAMGISEVHLEHIRVRDMMHTGILTTDPDTPLRVVARLMAEQRVHAIAVADPDHTRRPYGFVTALNVVAAAAAGGEETAADAAITQIVTVTSSDTLDHAARLMTEHGLSHVIVVDPASGHPSGVLSALDIASAYAS